MVTILTMVASVIASIVKVISTGFYMIFKGLGLMVWWILKGAAYGLWYGVIMLPVYIVRIFKRLFKSKSEGAAQ